MKLVWFYANWHFVLIINLIWESNVKGGCADRCQSCRGMFDSCSERASHCWKFHVLFSRSLTVALDTRLSPVNKPYSLVVYSLVLIIAYQTTHQKSQETFQSSE